jgi:hypothetical protein
MAGIQQLGGDALAKLKAGLASQSAPPNPATDKDRSDPAEATLLDIQRVRRSLEVAKDHLPEGDPRVVLFAGVHGAFSRLLSSVELSDAVDILLEQCFPLSSPHLKQKLQAMFTPPPVPGLGGGGAGMPGMPGKPPMGAAGPPTGPLPGPPGPPGALGGQVGPPGGGEPSPPPA